LRITIPSFKNTFLWPKFVKDTKRKNSKESVVTSVMWQKYYIKKEEDKLQKENEKKKQ